MYFLGEILFGQFWVVDLQDSLAAYVLETVTPQIDLVMQFFVCKSWRVYMQVINNDF